MTTLSDVKTSVIVGISVGALFGCAARGPSYPEVAAQSEPVATDQVRIVLLRPNNRYDDYSAGKAALRVNDESVGAAYGDGTLSAAIVKPRED